MLLLTVALALLCAAIDYKALPQLVARYVKPTGGNLSHLLRFGKMTISLLVGVYTKLALLFNVYGLTVAARLLVMGIFY